MLAPIYSSALEKYYHRTYGDPLFTRLGSVALVAGLTSYVGIWPWRLAALWAVFYLLGECSLVAWWHRVQPILRRENEGEIRRLRSVLTARSAILSAFATLPTLISPFHGAVGCIVGAVISAGILLIVAAQHSLHRQMFLVTAPVGAIALIWNLMSLGHGAVSWIYAALGIGFVINARFLQVANSNAFQEMVSHQIDAERALKQSRESEALYKLLADNQTDVISLWTGDRKCKYISPSAERIFGIPIPEILDRSEFGTLHPDDFEVVNAALEALTPTSGPVTAEYRMLDRNGAEIWVETLFQQLQGGGNDVLTTSRVVTERRRLNQDLVRALDEAKTALVAKQDFLANMTHELRTPLNAIIGFSSVLKTSQTADADDARRIGLIWDASQTLLGIINDVLDFSKLEAGIELEFDPFDPRQLADSAVSLLAGEAGAKGLTLSVETEGPGGLLIGDAGRLRQVLLNFLSNAIKFTTNGEIAVRVSQQADGALRRLRIEVKDTGIGVPPDQLETIFDRFTQADASVSRQYGGTGLGLAICKRIMDALNGDLGVVSRLGAGSTFWLELSLPIAGAGEQDAPDISPSAVVEPCGRVLVVDDNDVNRELVCTLLSPFDLVIETARDGVEALEAVAAASFDVILMDVQMPNMDGLTATRRIRASAAPAARRVPIIAMTANVLPDQVARCLAAGMDDHLGKPISPQRLLETLDRWMGPDPRPSEAGAQGAPMSGAQA